LALHSVAAVPNSSVETTPHDRTPDFKCDLGRRFRNVTSEPVFISSKGRGRPAGLYHADRRGQYSTGSPGGVLWRRRGHRSYADPSFRGRPYIVGLASYSLPRGHPGIL